jgi:hypothetical protein
MDAAQILDQLAKQGSLPIAALRAAGINRDAVLPFFLEAIERYLSGADLSIPPDALFFVFHLLGEWRERSAYRPLARLLQLPGDQLDTILGGGITETTHRVMASVFDGDPEPLYRIVLDAQADEYVRSRMCEDLVPKVECFVWHGWQSAIALLGLAEFKPLVEQAFNRRSICTSWLAFKDFEQDLQLTIQDPMALWRGGEFDLMGDTIEVLSSWYCFSPQAQRKHEPVGVALDQPWSATRPARKVGRNELCPCGSGRKFKKCCLMRQVEPAVLARTSLEGAISKS